MQTFLLFSLFEAILLVHLLFCKSYRIYEMLWICEINNCIVSILFFILFVVRIIIAYTSFTSHTVLSFHLTKSKVLYFFSPRGFKTFLIGLNIEYSIRQLDVSWNLFNLFVYTFSSQIDVYGRSSAPVLVKMWL